MKQIAHRRFKFDKSKISQKDVDDRAKVIASWRVVLKDRDESKDPNGSPIAPRIPYAVQRKINREIMVNSIEKEVLASDDGFAEIDAHTASIIEHGGGWDYPNDRPYLTAGSIQSSANLGKVIGKICDQETIDWYERVRPRHSPTLMVDILFKMALRGIDVEPMSRFC